MGNPLERFLLVNEKADGVYITVTSQAKNDISLDALLRVLDEALVTNYDPAQLRKAYERASGTPVRIGPPFEYYDPAIERFIDVVASEEKADMRVLSAFLENNISLSVASITFCLRRKGVVFGIKPEAIKGILDKGRYDIDATVAQWKPPVDGADGSMELEVKLSADTRPQVRDDGSVDYRDIQTFTQVGQGQVIARKIPPTAGEPGTTVTGKSVAPNPGKEIVLTPGKNTQVSDDGMYLLAARPGVLKQDGHVLNVLEMLTVSGDVDFSVGNIKYSGDLVINGSVMPGFTVEADGNVVIKGNVESAKVVSRNGTVTIHQGIIGKGDAVIFGKAGVSTHFAQEAELRSEGTIRVEKHLLHCTCHADALEMVQHGSGVVGGHIQAYSSIILWDCGNESGIETRLSLIDKTREANEEKLKELDALAKKILEKFDPVKKQVQAKAAIFKKAGISISDRQKAEMKKWIDAYNSYSVKLKYVLQKSAELKTALTKEAVGDGFVRVSGDLFPGTILTLYGTTKMMRNRMTGKVFRSNMGIIDDGTNV